MIAAFMEAQQQASERALASVLAGVNSGDDVANALHYAVNGGGKRLRPMLCVACYEAVAGKKADENVALLGAAIELIHTYSLVHDDLPCMDDDDVRRGRPTAHRVYGETAAMLAGAALIPLAFRTAQQAARNLKLSDADCRKVTVALGDGAGAAGMVGGQVLDLAAESAPVDLDRLEGVHAAKTGALLRAACRLGGIAAQGTDAQLKALDGYGWHLGLAFQITDDVLDETASTEQLGKTAGKDRDVAKATYPALLGVPAALERASTQMQAAITVLTKEGLATDTLVELCRFAVARKR